MTIGKAGEALANKSMWFLFLWLALSSATRGFAQEFAEAERWPTATFDVGGIAASVLPASPFFEDVKLTDNAIHLAFSSPSPARNRPRQYGVIRLSRAGSLIGATALPAGVIGDVVFDENGDVFFSRLMPDHSVCLEHYAETGEISTTTLSAPPKAIGVLGRTPIILEVDGSLLPVSVDSPLRSDIRAVTVSRVPQMLHMLAIDDHTVAIIDKFTTSISIADLSGASVATMRLDFPQVRETLRKFDVIAPEGSPTKARPVLFVAATGDAHGNMFLALGAGKLSGGMLVFQADRRGKYVRSLRLLAPQVKRLANVGNPSGWVLQRKLSAAGSTIATLSGSGIVSLFEM